MGHRSYYVLYIYVCMYELIDWVIHESSIHQVTMESLSIFPGARLVSERGEDPGEVMGWDGGNGVIFLLLFLHLLLW